MKLLYALAHVPYFVFFLSVCAPVEIVGYALGSVASAFWRNVVAGWDDHA